jgi:hypothetical protein
MPCAYLPNERWFSLHRSQILRDLSAMQAAAAQFSGYAGKFGCFSGEKSFKQLASIYLF